MLEGEGARENLKKFGAKVTAAQNIFKRATWLPPRRAKDCEMADYGCGETDVVDVGPMTTSSEIPCKVLRRLCRSDRCC